MARVLVVDDEDGLRQTMALFLRRAGHVCRTAGDVAHALADLALEPADVIISDIVMPGGGGIALLEAVRDRGYRSEVIMVTGEPTVETAVQAIRSGAFDYVAKPLNSVRLCEAVASAARLRQIEDEDAQYRQDLERLVEARTTSLHESLERLRRTMENTTQALSRALEIRDPYTAGHQRRVTHLSCAIHDRLPAELRLTAAGRDGLRIAGLLHDLGKLAIPAEILAKPARLSSLEINLIRAHPVIGWEILNGLDFGWPVADIVRQHHERVDGTGYPDGLKGEEIRLESRILGVADVLEAMASHRPYRPALGIETALAEIRRGSGTAFDGTIVEACVGLFLEDGYVLDSGAPTD